MAIDWSLVPSHVLPAWLLVHARDPRPARGHVPIAPLVWNGDVAVGAKSFAARCRRARPLSSDGRFGLASMETFAYGQLYLRRSDGWALDCWNFDVASHMIPSSWLEITGTELGEFTHL